MERRLGRPPSSLPLLPLVVVGLLALAPQVFNFITAFPTSACCSGVSSAPGRISSWWSASPTPSTSASCGRSASPSRAGCSSNSPHGCCNDR
ncbi:hypothetical protein [Tessaracoccus coleopterorum]|uniref:hypothetical protein n=1 Tax=Tessaracoccus coleopterorum TaxID=2714950 RepID=UPI001E454AC4|nr:hypothetical protein [Tessaracoccus coleopterorum]